MPHVVSDNVWIGLAQRNRKEFDSPAITSLPCARHVIERGANLFPLFLKRTVKTLSLESVEDQQGPYATDYNVSIVARMYLSKVDLETQSMALFFHAVATLHSLAYQQENSGALRQDWPRVPLPSSRDTLQASGALGKRIAALLDVETHVTGVTNGRIREELRPIAVTSRVGGGQLADATQDLAVTAGWGYFGHRGAVMAGKGRAIVRAYTPEELAEITAWRNPLGLPLAEAFALLGETTVDVYLNDRAFWRNVPTRVWAYTMGGYQVLKKWLSYREQEVLGRPLTLDEARQFRDIARRIAALLLLEPHLDANYRAVKDAPYPWSTAGPTTASTRSLWDP